MSKNKKQGKPVRSFYHKEKCPNCNTKIPHYAIEGDMCKTCGYNFLDE